MPTMGKQGLDRPRGLRPTAGPSRAAIILSLAFLALGSLALFVVFGLPAYVAPLRDPAPPVATTPQRMPASQQSDSAARPMPDPNQAEAEKLLAEVLRRLARLEADGGRIWAVDLVEGVSFATAEELLGKANALRDRQQFTDSLPLFQAAIASFDRLAETKPERFRLAMAAGRAALENLEASAAVARFEVAVAIAPGEPQARYLERARKLPEVLSKLAQAQQAEGAGNLYGARDGYGVAAALDPDFGPAREHLKRVENLIATNEYRAAVSDGLVRLNEGNIRGAQAALERALKINPKAPELDDLRQRIRAASQLASLDRLRAQSEELERQEKWADAVKVYDQALAIDASAAFAGRGRARALSLSQMHSALDRYIAEPLRLQSAEPRAHAKALVAQADASGEQGQALAAKRQQLARLISLAEAPVPVVLRSDRNTEIDLYRVGKLGTFDTRRVDLPPGRYIAVGSRPGYRDVRVQFEVSQAAHDEAIVIQCTEPIR
jgi:tetratricopeptide (TPR) repeat protein